MLIEKKNYLEKNILHIIFRYKIQQQMWLAKFSRPECRFPSVYGGEVMFGHPAWLSSWPNHLELLQLYLRVKSSKVMFENLLLCNLIYCCHYSIQILVCKLHHLFCWHWDICKSEISTCLKSLNQPIFNKL